jgi:predicted ribosome quality control (RQC) complex YloA/Tae2 family protein
MPTSPFRRRTKHINADRIANPNLDQYTILEGLTFSPVEIPKGERADLKSEMSSLDIAAVTLEVASLIKGKYLDNVYQTDDKTFLFKFRPGDFSLMVEVGRRIHLTKYRVQTPRQPSQFCMALRKRLRGGHLTDIRQHEFERTVIFDIETWESVWQLIVEFFRRGNLIVVDKSGKISLALSYVRMRDRNVVKDEPFRYAPSSGLNPLTISREHMSLVREHGSVPTTKALVMTLSIGGPLAKEILQRSAIEDKLASRLTDKDLDNVYHVLENLRFRLQKGDLDPIVVFDEKENPCDVAPFSLRSFEQSHRKEFPSFNEAADEYFTDLAHCMMREHKKDALRTKEEELTRITAMQQKQLGALHKAIEDNNLKGQLAMKNLHYLQLVISRVLAKKKQGVGAQKIIEEVQETLNSQQAPVQISSIEPSKGMILARIENVEISLSFRAKPQDEAERYFKAAKRAREKMTGLGRAMGQAEARAKVMAVEKQKASEPSAIEKRKERHWYEKFRWFTSSDGFLVLAGRDAATNEILIKKHTSPSDIVLHGEAHGAPFVVVKTNTAAPSDSTILEAAQFAISHSRMWKDKAASGDAYWVRPDQVSKEAPSGQYLTRGAFMVTGKRNYIKGLELRLAIGIQLEGDNARIIGGPPSAVRTHALSCVEIVPGATARHNLARQILFELTKAQQIKSQIKALTTDELMNYLPSGPGDIVSPKQSRFPEKP